MTNRKNVGASKAKSKLAPKTTKTLYDNSSTDSNKTQSIKSLAIRGIEQSTSRKPTKNQVAEIQENVNEEQDEVDGEKNFIPAILHAQYLLWNVPFITVLTAIAGT